MLDNMLGFRAREFYWDHPWLQEFYGALSSLSARVAAVSGNSLAALDLYCDAARRVRDPVARNRRLEEFARFVGKHFGAHPPRSLMENVFVQHFQKSSRASLRRLELKRLTREQRLNLGKSLIVLKSPRRDERGVLLIHFHGAFEWFFLNYDLRKVVPLFRVVLQPGWSSIPEPHLALFSSEEAPSGYQVISEESVAIVRATGLPILPIALGSQDWVDPDVFRPLPGVEKDFDLVMIANFAPWKRHAVLFRAMRQLRPRRIRAAIVGRTWGRSRADFDGELRRAGVADDCVVFQGLKAAQVNEVLSRSKVNVLLSKIEGGNKGLMEGFAADVPCVVYKHILGPRHSDINSMTGLFAEDDDLAEVLARAIDSHKMFRPREWFLQNTGYRKATEKLNALLRDDAVRRGEPWTEDIVPKVNRPRLEYPDDSYRSRVEEGWKVLDGALLPLEA